MTTQPTSAEAYRDAVASGLIAGRQREVAKAFVDHGPGTSAEVLTAAGLGANLNLMRARVTELADAGALRPLPARRCLITKRRAIVWDFVGSGGTPRVKAADPTKIAVDLAAEAVAALASMILRHGGNAHDCVVLGELKHRYDKLVEAL